MHNIIRRELNGLYGQEVLKDMNEIIKLYDFYEGKGQEWDTPQLDYKPTKKITNYVKKLIKEEARFLFGKTPFFDVECESEENALKLKGFIDSTLEENKFSSKLIKAARDCFIGKRVALKISAVEGKIKVDFKNSLEFVYETRDDDIDEVNKIIFFYQLNDKGDKGEQRIWKQSYELIEEKCILNEAIYDGAGRVIEVMFEDYDTGLNFIPAVVIINDGLTGDLKGESDVAEIMDNQMAYNKLLSDDIDALRFNMFPQTVATDASGESMEHIKIAPAALVDLQTDVTANHQAKMEKLESSFGYDQRFENSIKRVKADMYDLLNIPNLSIEDMSGTVTSAKAIKALYWQLITRCEEKWQEWEPALIWMAEKIIEMSRVYDIEVLPDTEYSVMVENIFPLMEDEYEEKESDRAEVLNQVRSKKSYIAKWQEDIDADAELKQIAMERDLLEDSYMQMQQGDIDGE